MIREGSEEMDVKDGIGMERADSVQVQMEVKEENIEVLERKQSTTSSRELPQRDVKDGREKITDIFNGNA